MSSVTDTSLARTRWQSARSTVGGCIRALAFGLLLVSDATRAADPASTHSPLRPTWMIAPYVWGPSVEGSVGIGGLSVPLDVGISELGSGIEAGGMGYLRWTRDRNFLHAEGLGLQFSDRRFEPFFNLDVDATVVFAELGAGRHFYMDVSFPASGQLQISPYAGVRHVRLKVEASDPRQSLQADDNWFDLTLGLILQAPLTQRLSYLAKLDAAGFDLDRDWYWSAQFGFNYDFGSALSGVVGYRVTRFDADAGGGNDLNLQLRASGPIIGVIYEF